MHSVRNAPFYHATADETVASMFEISWYTFMAMLSSVIEEASDTRMVTTCMDGFKYSMRLAARLRLKLEKEALAGTLARFTFRIKNDLSPRPIPEIGVKRLD